MTKAQQPLLAAPHAALDSLVYLFSQKTSKLKILQQVLPNALSISQGEVGTLLVAERVEPVPEPDADETSPDHQLVPIAQQGMSKEMIEVLVSGDLGQHLYQGKQFSMGLKARQLDAMQSLLRRHKLQKLVGIPLQFDKVVLGAILLGTRSADDHFFDLQQRQLLVVLANMTALLLDHIRLHTEKSTPPAAQSSLSHSFDEASPPAAVEESEELESLLAAMMNVEDEIVSQNQDLGMLNALSSQVNSTLQLEQVLDNVLDQTIDVLDAESGWCYLYDSDMLHLSWHKGLSPRYVDSLKFLKPGDGVEGMTFLRNEPIIRDAALFHDNQARMVVLAEGLKTVAAVPLIQETKPFGILAVGAREARDWSGRDERMLASISEQASNAVYNARQYTAVEHKIELLKTENITLAEDKGQLSLEFERLKHQTREILRLQERAWAAQAASPQLDRVVSGSKQIPNSQMLGSIRRALEALSSARYS